MCGRYYVDDDTVEDMIKIVKEMDMAGSVPRGDVHPTENAFVIRNRANNLTASGMKWGFDNPFGSGVIFNARQESAFDKKMFRSSITERRCIIPAAGFYELDKSKNKVTFTRADNGPLYLAGFYRLTDEVERFIILTKEADNVMSPVHPRMPVIIERKDIDAWIYDTEIAKHLMENAAARIKAGRDYEQMSLDLS